MLSMSSAIIEITVSVFVVYVATCQSIRSGFGWSPHSVSTL